MPLSPPLTSRVPLLLLFRLRDTLLPSIAGERDLDLDLDPDRERLERERDRDLERCRLPPPLLRLELEGKGDDESEEYEVEEEAREPRLLRLLLLLLPRLGLGLRQFSAAMRARRSTGARGSRKRLRSRLGSRLASLLLATWLTSFTKLLAVASAAEAAPPLGEADRASCSTLAGCSTEEPPLLGKDDEEGGDGAGKPADVDACRLMLVLAAERAGLGSSGAGSSGPLEEEAEGRIGGCLELVVCDRLRLTLRSRSLAPEDDEEEEEDAAGSGLAKSELEALLRGRPSLSLLPLLLRWLRSS